MVVSAVDSTVSISADLGHFSYAVSGMEGAFFSLGVEGKYAGFDKPIEVPVGTTFPGSVNVFWDSVTTDRCRHLFGGTFDLDELKKTGAAINKLQAGNEGENSVAAKMLAQALADWTWQILYRATMGGVRDQAQPSAGGACSRW